MAERCLSAAGRADQSNRFALIDVQRQILDDISAASLFLFPLILKADVVKINGSGKLMNI